MFFVEGAEESEATPGSEEMTGVLQNTWKSFQGGVGTGSRCCHCGPPTAGCEQHSTRSSLLYRSHLDHLSHRSSENPLLSFFCSIAESPCLPRRLKLLDASITGYLALDDAVRTAGGSFGNVKLKCRAWHGVPWEPLHLWPSVLSANIHCLWGRDPGRAAISVLLSKLLEPVWYRRSTEFEPWLPRVLKFSEAQWEQSHSSHLNALDRMCFRIQNFLHFTKRMLCKSHVLPNTPVGHEATPHKKTH